MGSSGVTTPLTILHFNDVYNIEPREQEPIGGASRFTTAVKDRMHLNPLILFSGDAFNPSLMSAVTKGKQMVPVLNAIGVHLAVYGNHDFDFGVDKLVKHAEACNFPWLMSNVIDNDTERPLAEGITSHIIDWQGKKVGFVGLVEEEWIATLSTVDEDDITYLDFVEEGRELVRELREQGADYVIALTHMRWPNDIRLAEQVPDIDLILGGHDHDYVVKQINGKYVIKSGTDFRQMSQVTLSFPENGKPTVEVEEVTIDSSIEEDEEVKLVVAQYQKTMGARMEKVLGHMEVEMDGRFANIRTQETNLGNFITNIMLESTDSEVAILNSGTLRSDAVHPKGQFKVKDLLAILPMVDPVVVIECTGTKILEALENGVSQYPKLEGRFPQVAGVTFGFDPNKTQGQRINRESVKVGGQKLRVDQTYRVSTKHYLAEGKDGYQAFKGCPLLVNDEEGPRLSTIVQNHFQAVAVMKGEKKSKFQHHQSLIPVNRRRTLSRQMSLSMETSLLDSPGLMTSLHMSPASHRPSLPDNIEGSPEKPVKSIASSPNFVTPTKSPMVGASPMKPKLLRRSTLCTPARAQAMFRRRSSIQSVEEDSCNDALAPQVEGRIFVINNNNTRQDFKNLRISMTPTIPEVSEASSH